MTELERKEFEQALNTAWKSYVDRGAATVDALEDNTQELAFAKGFKAGYEQYKQGYKDAKEKAYKWLSEQMFELHVELNACEEIYVADGQASSLEEFLNNFKQAMEEQQ